MHWKRTTRDIVISRSRRRQEQEAEKQQAEKQQEAENMETQNQERQVTVPENQSKEDITVKKVLDRKWIWIAAGAAAILFLAVLLLLPRGEEQIDIPEGAVVVALQDSILSENVTAGDIVQIFDHQGHVVPQLRYVQVFGVTPEGGLLLVLEPSQASALAMQEAVTAALVARSGEQAEELLSQQQRILRPQVTLRMTGQMMLKPGETGNPALEVLSDPEDGIVPEILWDSSNPDAASVSPDGTVTAIAAGETVISAVCGEAKAECTVVVQIPLTGLTLNKTDARLTVGETLTLAVTPEPADATGVTVKWSSSDPAVATVAQDGTVTAAAPGKAVITAVSGEARAECTVTVGVHTELVQLKQHTVSLTAGEKVKLEYAVSPAENNFDKAVFKSDKPDVATVAEDGTVTAVGPGTATVTVTCGSATDACTVTVE